MKNNIKLGFSSLALFMKPLDEVLQLAIDDGFEIIEILCEAHYSPWYILKNKEILKPLYSTDLEINFHGPTVDLNLASLNKGIREESIKQTLQSIDLAAEFGVNTVTIHPGIVGRKEERIREIALEYTRESLEKAVNYGDKRDVKVSLENMPDRFSFLCNKVEELEYIVEKTGCYLTIDLGHANTCENPSSFLDISNIEYCHLNDNNGKKDTHSPIGHGTLDLNLIKKVKKGIIELNNYDNVLESKKVIEEIFK